MVVRDAGIHVYRSSRVEGLSELLCQRLADSLPPDPTQPHKIVVGSRGMERWLKHRIAAAHGICSNINFMFPNKALDELTDDILRSESGETDPWSSDSLPWSIIQVLPRVWKQSAFAPVRSYLFSSEQEPVDFEESTEITSRIWSWARAVADALERYLLYRPDWIESWEGPNPQPSSVRHLGWQVLLWSELTRTFGDSQHSERLLSLKRLKPAASTDSQFPPALYFFGLSAMRPSMLEQIRFLGQHARIEIYGFAPTREFWGDFIHPSKIRSIRMRYRETERDELLGELRSLLEDQPPLLTTLGRLSREFQMLVEEIIDPYQGDFIDADDERESMSVLHCLQSDIRTLKTPKMILDEGVRTWDEEDRSVSIHACYGPTRQVEALREALLGLFAKDPTLRPKDIVVMTPDVKTYAPLVSSIFRQGKESLTPRQLELGDSEAWGDEGGPRIPISISDLGLRSLNPVSDVLLQVLELSERRAAASRVLDLLSTQVVLQRFNISWDELEILRTWIAASGVRWGFDGEDRSDALGLDDEQNTWLFGMQRMALGAVMRDQGQAWSGTLPYDQIEGQNVLLLGRFLSFVRTLQGIVSKLRTPCSMQEWTKRLRGIVQGLTETTDKQAWLKEQVMEELDKIDAD